jgi:hypothetical protein
MGQGAASIRKIGGDLQGEPRLPVDAGSARPWQGSDDAKGVGKHEIKENGRLTTPSFRNDRGETEIGSSPSSSTSVAEGNTGKQAGKQRWRPHRVQDDTDNAHQRSWSTAPRYRSGSRRLPMARTVWEEAPYGLLGFPEIAADGERSRKRAPEKGKRLRHRFTEYLIEGPLAARSCIVVHGNLLLQRGRRALTRSSPSASAGKLRSACRCAERC